MSNPNEHAADVQTLYRPVGQAELDLIRGTGYRAFPPRPHQLVFCPALSEAYAVQIARDWNTKDSASGFVGYVTRFRVRRAFLDCYEVHQAGGSLIEYWIPAEDLADFNTNIVGEIEVVAKFDGEPTGVAPSR